MCKNPVKMINVWGNKWVRSDQIKNVTLSDFSTESPSRWNVNIGGCIWKNFYDEALANETAAIILHELEEVHRITRKESDNGD
jgi:hypothetical protein